MGSLRYVLRNLGRRRIRTILGAVGIFLTIAFLTAIQIGLDSVSTSYIDLVALQAGKADVLISAKDSNPVSPDTFDPEKVFEGIEGTTELKGLAPRLVGLVEVSKRGEFRHALLIGLDPGLERKLDISGLKPEPVLRDELCALSTSLARGINAKSGAKVTIDPQGRGKEITLRLDTIIEQQLVVPQQMRDYVVVTEATARKILDEPTGVHFLAGAFKNPKSYYDARDLSTSVNALKDVGQKIAADLGGDYQIQLPKAAAITAFQDFTSPLRAVFGVFALLALAITGLLIYSLISVAVEERIREYAILRTLGAKRREIFQLVLIESGLLCMIGVVPGVLIGTLFAQGIVNIVEMAMGAEGDPISLAVSWGTLGLTFLAGALLSIGSALLPAFRSVRWRIVDALDPMRRGQIPPKPPSPDGSSRPLVLTGVALSALAVVVFFVLPIAVTSGDPSLIGTAVLCLLLTILLGFTLIAMGALPLVERIVLAITGWFYGSSAELAGRNLVRHRRRNTTTALMFTLSVSLVIFVASLVALFSGTSLAMVEQSNGADIRMQTGDPFAVGLKDTIEKIDDVETVSETMFLRSRSSRGIAYDVVISDLVGMRHVWIVPYGVDPDLAKVLYKDRVQYVQGGPSAFGKLAEDEGVVEANGPDTDKDTKQKPIYPPMILSASVAEWLSLDVGDVVQLAFHLGSVRKQGRFQIEAVCGAIPGFRSFRTRVSNRVGSGALISLKSFDMLTEEAPDEAFQALYLVKAAPGDKIQRMVARDIRNELGAQYRFGVHSTVEEKDQARNLYWATQVFFGLLMAVAVVIAVFALIASMATSVIERRWEIGVLKSLGLRRKQLFRMFLGEAVSLTLSAGIAGGVIGFLLAYMFVLQAAALIEMPIIFTMPYLTFIATFGISIVAGAVAAFIPTRRILRLSAAEILRTGS
jgi:putative ABC transport system permease protein